MTEIDELRAERDLWRARAEALLKIAQAACEIVGQPYDIKGWRGYNVPADDYERLRRAVERYIAASETEGRR